MRNKLSLYALAAIGLLAASCNNEGEEAAAPAKYITVSSGIESQTRTTVNAQGTQVFEQDDAISVYAWTGSATAINPAALVVNNSLNTYDGTRWTAAPQMLWKDMTTAHFFLGIYPSHAVTDFTADAFTLDLAKGQEANDLLVAVNTGADNAGFTATNDPIPLLFDHVMSKLIVNLSFRNQWGGTPVVESVTTKNLQLAATVNYLTKTVTAVEAAAETSATPADIVLPVITANAKYESVMIPQAGQETQIAVKIAGKDYIYTGEVRLESGKYTTVNLIVGRDEITLGSVDINGWGEGGTINGGEAQED